MNTICSFLNDSIFSYERKNHLSSYTYDKISCDFDFYSLLCLNMIITFFFLFLSYESSFFRLISILDSSQTTKKEKINQPS